MQPENLKFGGGPSGSLIHPLVLIAMILVCLMILFLRRQLAIAPILYITFLVPNGQQLNVAGAHVLVLRIVIFVALLRAIYSMLFSKGRGFAGGFCKFDMVFLLWSFFHVIAFLVLFAFVPAALVNQSGFLWTYSADFWSSDFSCRMKRTSTGSSALSLTSRGLRRFAC